MVAVEVPVNSIILALQKKISKNVEESKRVNIRATLFKDNILHSQLTLRLQEKILTDREEVQRTQRRIIDINIVY